jgi:hypothetical protein
VSRIIERTVRFLFALSQSLLEENGDSVCDSLQILVTLLLGGLETTGDMPLDEGHGYGI